MFMPRNSRMRGLRNPYCGMWLHSTAKLCQRTVLGNRSLVWLSAMLCGFLASRGACKRNRSPSARIMCFRRLKR